MPAINMVILLLRSKVGHKYTSDSAVCSVLTLPRKMRALSAICVPSTVLNALHACSRLICTASLPPDCT